VSFRRLLSSWLCALLLVPTAFSRPPGAAPDARSSSSRPPSVATEKSPEPGTVVAGLYRNTFFSFSYKVPVGWVDRTRDMGELGGPVTAAHAGIKEPRVQEKSLVLLSIFERPPEARGETPNSSVVIAAESESVYPGLKNAAQYFGPLDEVATKNGFERLGEPYDFPVHAQPLVRSDYSKELGTTAIHQSTLVLLRRGYAVSFTFIGESDDEVTQLIAGLAFRQLAR